ncbi:MAG: Gfo/Idh/MocA family oxidoreductase [Planctomycetaceae bacterium]|nr:Gfo/Idh/MocA family oxidoreductase [Planctomycetaceae bacterium]
MPRQVRYAVVGLGHIAQVAVLPAFRHAKRSVLAALVSGDEEKRRELSRRYKVDFVTGYDGYDSLLRSGSIDAVYIALPNDQHRDYTVRAARAGIHVLCEKPMATTEADCRAMIDAAREASVRLMIAYRLHFDPATLEAIRLIRNGQLGNPRLFNSTFAMQVREGNIRAKRRRGGGPLYDIGIYCINAARYLFRDEPIEVSAVAVNNGERRFDEIDEAVSATLRFPGSRLATFVTSFGAADAGRLQVVGSKGRLELDPAYEYAEGLTLEVTKDERTRRRKFAKHDQFAAELEYFSDCVLNGKEPEPSGEEGLADVRIIQALDRSIASGRRVKLSLRRRSRRPGPAQKVAYPGIRKPRRIVRARSPHPD